MKLYVGSDHRGFESKGKLLEFLQAAGHDVEDTGDTKYQPEDDFPQFAGRCASAVLASDHLGAKGILICGSGQGMCMAANRFRGIRASLGYDKASVQSARNDDDANVLCLPAELIEVGDWETLVTTFLETPFAAAPRFIRRLKEIDELG